MPKTAVTLSNLNAMDRADFAAALASVFEGAPAFVAQAWDARPFASVAALYAAGAEQQVALIAAHPDLVGRAALAGTLSRESTQEQAAAGLDRLTPDEIAAFTRLNAAYRDRFGFPFVICARENKKESILAGFATRLEHTHAEEIDAALGEIAKIAALRLADLVAPA